VQCFKYFGKLIQVGLLVLLIIVVESSNTTKENKILNDNYKVPKILILVI
jgi:hypothetical protein